MSPQEFAELIDLPEADKKVLSKASSHVKRCRCDTCRRWWQLMGPANAEDAGMPKYVLDYGPFTREEIET